MRYPIIIKLLEKKIESCEESIKEGETPDYCYNKWDIKRFEETIKEAACALNVLKDSETEY